MRHASLLIRRNELYAQFVRTKALIYRWDLPGLSPLSYEQALVVDELQRLTCALMDLWDLEVAKFPVPKFFDAPIALPALTTQLSLERDRSEPWPLDYHI